MNILKIQKVSDGEFRTTLEVQTSKTFFIWVIGTLGKVKITSPVSVKREFNEFVESIKNRCN